MSNDQNSSKISLFAMDALEITSVDREARPAAPPIPTSPVTPEWRPRVALFEKRPKILAQWMEELALSCELFPAHDDETLNRILADHSVDVIIAGASDSLAAIAQRLPAGAKLIYCGPELTEAAVETAAKGHTLSLVTRTKDLSAKIFAVTRAPRSAAARHQLRDMAVRVTGTQTDYTLLEISNHGMSLGILPEQPIESLLPGSVLGPLEVRQGPTLALDGVKVIVRHIQLGDGREVGYRIGCEFLPPETDVHPGTHSIVDDRAQCAALIRTALRTDGIQLESAKPSGYPVHCTAGQIDLVHGEFTVTAGDHALAPYEIVRGQFETGGKLYVFITTVITRSPLRMCLPTSLQERRHRNSGRFVVPEKKPIMVELSTALLRGPILRPIRDLSSTGFSFDINMEIDLFPVGMHFTKLSVAGAGTKFQCRGRVKNLTRYPGPDNILRCGVEFEDLSEKTRVQLTDFIMRSRFPGLEDGRTVTFDEWWQFFRDTGFLFPEKEAALAPLMPEVRRMYESLNARPTKLFKAVVARSNNKLVGHMSGLRAYSRTWMFHHLAALNGHNVGHLVSLGGNECFDQGENEYFKAWFHSDVRWPNRVFGGMAKKIDNPALSDLRRYGHFMLPTDWSCPAPFGIQIIEAVGSDLAVVERFFVTTEKGVLLKADDLTRSELTLPSVNASYATLGLQRRRRVLLALKNDTPVGIALAEISSPGLNLSEGLSSFRIYVTDDGMPLSGEVRKALVSAVMPLYRQAGRPFALGLIPATEAPEYIALGFDAGKESLCWTCHRSLYHQIFGHIERIFEVLKKREGRNLARKTRG